MITMERSNLLRNVWLFTTGSVVTLLIACQFVTGLGLTMYYVPSPKLA